MSGGGHRGHTAGPGSGGGGGASGCPAIQQNGARCGETKTLDIIREFRELYETKMKIIDSEAGGDCNVQAKLNLQTDWIHDLTEQNEMLVRAVEELEQEATQRVLALEDKLKETSKCCCENEDKENKIRELEEKLRMTCEEVAMAKKVNENYAALKQSMLEMRDALTTEVADKHDTILALRRDVQMLEEQCRKADQQTHFKDDIIKELRKENKQLKEKKSPATSAKQKSRPQTTSPKQPVKSEPAAEPHFNYRTNEGLDDALTFTCPIPSHKNLEKYKDFQNRVVIFVCEDVQQKEIERVFDGRKYQMVYKNPKVVHEYERCYLERLTKQVGEFSSSMDSSFKSSDIPEKLVDPASWVDKLSTFRCEAISPEATSTPRNSRGTYEIINSHPPKNNSKKTGKKKKHVSHIPLPKKRNFDCFSCVIEPTYTSNKFERFLKSIENDPPVKMSSDKEKYVLSESLRLKMDKQQLDKTKTFMHFKDFSNSF